MRRHLFAARVSTAVCCAPSSSSSLLLMPTTVVVVVVVARRFQRSAPGRVRLQKEGLQSSTASSTSSSSGTASTLQQQQRDTGTRVFLNTTGMPVGGVEEGRRGFLGFGRRAGRAMPLNPLLALRPKNEEPDEDRITARFLQAVQQLNGKRRRRNESLTLQLTEEQRHDIVNRYAQTRWYGFLWRPARNVTERQFKWWRRFAHLALLVVVLFGLGTALLLYYREVETVLQLSPEDRRDYQHIVTGMRFSEIYNLAMEVLRKEDPLEALPMPARYHLLLEAARARGWHTMDWEL
ncbi:hypothetical protein DQ04_05861000, partial [Trypanosoma grayi]|uniref:hypothetical protein n=1 Tax=Trypanosoma grayi TaxID=71804 RepID=UPI0004F465C5